MKEIKLDIHKRLQEACDDLELKPRGRNQALCKQLHVTQPAVSKWLTGKAYPSIDKLVELAAFLHVNVEWLVTGTGPKSNKERYPSEEIQEIVELISKLPKEKQKKVLLALQLFFSD